MAYMYFMDPDVVRPKKGHRINQSLTPWMDVHTAELQ